MQPIAGLFAYAVLLRMNHAQSSVKVTKCQIQDKGITDLTVGELPEIKDCRERFGIMVRYWPTMEYYRRRRQTPDSITSLPPTLRVGWPVMRSRVMWCALQSGGVESVIRKYGSRDVCWSSQGMLRLSTEAMRRLFQPTLERIKQAIGDVLNHPNARGTSSVL